MSILTQYILKKFLKYFFIILLSLELFFVGIDLMQNFKELPNSANLQLLYILYNAFFTLSITLPISIIFAWITTLVYLVRHNELVASFSLGSSKKMIYMPVVFISTAILIAFISLQMTPLAYAYEQKSKIIKGMYFTNTKSNLFLKYNNYFIYFKKLHPLEKKAQDIHIFKIKDNDIEQSIIAKSAHYQNNKWYVVDAKIITKPSNIGWDESAISIRYEKFLDTLEGFNPKILNNVYDTKSNFSILDAYKALQLLDKQGVNTNKIKASLYYQLFSYFIVLPLIILFFAFIGVSSRFFNTARFTAVSIFTTLVVWGIFFMLFKLSMGDVITAEIAVLLPLALLYASTPLLLRIRTSS
ncbi:MAG: LptF/LptG family permease [Campylobacterota bacterium]|nr:LptF/LptG family permease [Campylobacterota bacterium]